MIGLDQVSPHEQDAWQPACSGMAPEVFFGPADSLAGRPSHIWERRALEVCKRCPIVAACLAEALKYPVAEQYGVVGGMTAGQRKAVMEVQRHGQGRAHQSQHRQDVLSISAIEARSAQTARPVAVPAAGTVARNLRSARPKLGSRERPPAKAATCRCKGHRQPG
jgi:WhiB family transcriptional regulator, redox-sensing transcriptional regulator